MFNTKLKVNFFDADPAGIIFFASIFRYAHSAYEDFISHLKLNRDYFFDDELVLPIIHAEADYLKPIRVGDELKIDLQVSRLQESSFELSYKFLLNDEPVATARTVHVCVSKNSFVKSELPVELSAGLGEYLI